MTTDTMDGPAEQVAELISARAAQAQWNIPQPGNTAAHNVPTLVLMAGFAGAGKTTLARRLAYCLNWRVLNKDDFKWKRLAQGEAVEDAGWHAFEDLFAHIGQEVVEKRKSVIIDTSNEKPFIFENVQEVLKNMADLHIYVPFKIILCVASKATRTKRLQQRGSVFEPYIQDLPTILDDSELFERFKHLPADKVLRVNTNPPLATYDWKVLRALNAPEE